MAVLGANSYTYAEATRDEQLANWIGAHVQAFEFYQGVPFSPDLVRIPLLQLSSRSGERKRPYGSVSSRDPVQMIEHQNACCDSLSVKF